MGFEAPAALALGLLAAAILALHLLRPRQREGRVPSILAWQALTSAGAAFAPRRRHRIPGSLLLYLQLAILAALVLALARPWRSAPGIVAPHLLLLVDRSMTMAARDGSPTRLDSARDAALARAEAAGDAAVTLIAFDREAELLLAGANDPARIQAALASLTPRLLPADAGDALRLASALAAGNEDSHLVIFSDGNFELGGALDDLPRVELVRVGSSDDNQSIASLDLDPGGTSLFVRVSNAAGAPVSRRVETRADGRLYDARDLSLPLGGQTAFTLALDGGVAEVETRLAGADVFPPDDVAWAIAPPPPRLSVSLVSSGNRFLEAALALLPEVASWSRREPAATPEDGSEPAEIVILDGSSPRALPPAALLVIAPPAPIGEGDAQVRPVGRLQNPIPRPLDPSHPLLAGLAFEDVSVLEAQALELGPAWNALLVAEVEDQVWPLMAEGRLGGHPALLLAFDLRASDLPLRPALPLWLAEAITQLAPTGPAGLPRRLDPGEPLSIALPAGTSALRVTDPSGETTALAIEQGRALHGATWLPGLYRIERETASGIETERVVVSLASGSAASIRPRDLPPALQATGMGIAEAGDGEGQAPGELPSDSDLAGPPAEPARGQRPLWTAFAWLALGLLLLEWAWDHRALLNRARSNRSRPGAEPSRDRANRRASDGRPA